MTALDKAKAALEAAKEEQPGEVRYHDLLEIARTQAAIAQAESLERIAYLLDGVVGLGGLHVVQR